MKSNAIDGSPRNNTYKHAAPPISLGPFDICNEYPLPYYENIISVIACISGQDPHHASNTNRWMSQKLSDLLSQTTTINYQSPLRTGEGAHRYRNDTSTLQSIRFSDLHSDTSFTPWLFEWVPFTDFINPSHHDIHPNQLLIDIQIKNA